MEMVEQYQRKWVELSIVYVRPNKQEEAAAEGPVETEALLSEPEDSRCVSFCPSP